MHKNFKGINKTKKLTQNKKVNKNILIEKHIQNCLSDKEKVIFNKLLIEDSSFKKQVAFQKKLKKAIQSHDQDNFKKLLNNVESNILKENHRSILSFNYKWIIAASLVLIFGMSFFLNVNRSYNPEEIFNNNFQPYKNVIYPINRGKQINQDIIKTNAFIAYEKGDYKKAIDLFSKLYTTTKETYYLFYKANALLKLNKTKEAITILKKHLNSKDYLSKKSNWYLALAYIKLNDTQKAKELLIKITEKKLYNYKKAENLLKKLS
jgi:predicted Zn-dependent protease